MDFYNNIFTKSGMGTAGTPLQSSFAGIDYRSKGLPVPANTDTIGLVFFTRPRLNLSYHNLTVFPEFKPYLDEDPNSLKGALRCLLDPVGHHPLFRKAMLSKLRLREDSSLPQLHSNLVDPYNPFIPFLSSNILSLSGWPDRSITPRVSDEGKRKESIVIPDGVYEINNVFESTATFRSIAGDPVTQLFNLWGSATSMMRVGSRDADFARYLDEVLNKEMPYTTRIYRLVLDSTKRYVRKMAMTGYSVPLAVNEGGAFDYIKESNQVENEVKTVQFSSSVARYNSPYIPIEFNRLVGMYNASMRPSDRRDPDSLPIGVVNGHYKKLVSDEDVAVYNTTAYPRIKLSTMELELFAPIK